MARWACQWSCPSHQVPAIGTDGDRRHQRYFSQRKQTAVLIQNSKTERTQRPQCLSNITEVIRLQYNEELENAMDALVQETQGYYKWVRVWPWAWAGDLSQVQVKAPQASLMRLPHFVSQWLQGREIQHHLAGMQSVRDLEFVFCFFFFLALAEGIPEMWGKKRMESIDPGQRLPSVIWLWS